jgi:hypothetical protein
MSHNKLAKDLMDAYMMGDKERVGKIQNEINLKYEQSLPKEKTKTVQINTVLNDDTSSAISVYDFLNKAMGQDWWELEFETIEKLLWVNYGTALEDINRDKVWAIRHVCRSDGAFSDWFEFNQAALSFAGAIADFDHLRSPSPGMVISAVKTLNYIRPDREKFFSNDVIKYICILLKENGIYTPPPSLFVMIEKEMRKIISPEVSAEWNDVLKRLRDITKKKVMDIEENVMDIQAKRLLKVETSASKY